MLKGFKYHKITKNTNSTHNLLCNHLQEKHVYQKFNIEKSLPGLLKNKNVKMVQSCAPMQFLNPYDKTYLHLKFIEILLKHPRVSQCSSDIL